MSKYKGAIADFPEEIVEKMLEKQKEQYGEENLIKLENGIFSGFDFNNTIEGYDFWHQVKVEKNFDIFFQLYPKKQKFKIGDKVKIIKIPKGDDLYGLTVDFYRRALGKVFTIGSNYHHDNTVTFKENSYTVKTHILEKIEEETHNFKVGDKVVVYKLPDKSDDNRYMINLNPKWFKENLIGKEFTIQNIRKANENYVDRAITETNLVLPLCSLKKVEEEFVKETVKAVVKEELDTALKKHYIASLHTITKEESETIDRKLEEYFDLEEHTLSSTIVNDKLPEIKIRNKKRIRIKL